MAKAGCHLPTQFIIVFFLSKYFQLVLLLNAKLITVNLCFKKKVMIVAANCRRGQLEKRKLDMNYKAFNTALGTSPLCMLYHNIIVQFRYTLVIFLHPYSLNGNRVELN